MKKSVLFTLMALTCLIGQVWGQDLAVTGTVISAEERTPLPGVSVVQKGTSNGSSTDASGRFSISVPGNATLVFSFIGMETQEIAVGNRTTINVNLRIGNSQQLEEIVVTGLASSIKRSNLANAVATVSAEELVGRTRPQTVDAALQGKVAGAVISQNTGAPGGGISMQLRGVSTLTGASQPLIIIDGVYANNEQLGNGAGSPSFTGASATTHRTTQDQTVNRLSDISPADIENIEILKGSSAAAIYGARANAGVVIITTKRGKAGRTNVSLGQDVGFVTASHLPGSSNWDEARLQAIYGSNPARLAEETALWRAANASGNIYDYEEEIFGNTGTVYNTRLSVSGGNEKTKFYVAASRNDESGIVKKTGFERNSIRANIDHQISKMFDLSLSSNYIRSSNQRGFTGNDNNGVALTYNLAYTPNYHELHPNEQGIFPDARNTGDNPLAIVERAVNDESTNRFIQAGTFDINLISEENSQLRFSVSGGIDYANTESQLYLPVDLQSQRDLANPGAIRNSRSRVFNTNLQAALVYNYNLLDNRFHMTTQVGTSRLTNETDLSHEQGLGLIAEQRNPNNSQVPSRYQRLTSFQDVGIFGQQEVNFEDKIIGTLGIRFDKSSLLGDHEKFYTFPKASLAVNVAKFGFWSIPQINQVKLRAAYGETGGMPVYGATFVSFDPQIIGGMIGIVPTLFIGNEEIEPERAQELELGIDLGFLDNKLTLEATYYNKEVKDLIGIFQIPNSTGITQIEAYPLGDLRNKGIELSLGYSPVQTQNFSWNGTVLYWQNRTEVTKINVPVQEFRTGFGASYGTNFFMLGESPTRWYGNPTVPGHPTGYTRYEEAQPDFQMSFANTLSFLRNFDFSFLLHWKKGGYISNLNMVLRDEGGTTHDWAEDDNGDGVVNGEERLGASARYRIQDGTYLRLRELALYYNLPRTLKQTLFRGYVQNAKIGVSANNLFTVTDYEGFDPEVSNFGNTPLGSQVDVGSFPNTKRVFFHLAFDF
ncbi:SusC/RagA family TonB-linked outer membrane protein [Rufibacter latericius]|uniref:SusC/RagA family TonB-linked outer membrane protein n=1 Tax=Rufibacter latericius TaxID=2487040 RepID=A0A3M9ML22_9BACT|nr:SusC/RagA family TonB-linked outer membrane protein [Rufibacter latericius]RNI25895.1 SusC/RagA family TonB-linked outer membrane protein [Rufibacter latericius]